MQSTSKQSIDKNYLIEDKISFLKKSKKWSVLVGVLITFYILIIQYFFNSELASYIKQGKYLFIFILFYKVFTNYKQLLPEGSIFQKGIVLGLYMSMFISLAYTVSLTLLGYGIGQIEIIKYEESINTFNKLITFDWMLLFETFVISNIVSFICLQGLKDSNIPN